MALWNLKGKKVLIIDDFQEMRAMLVKIIEPLTPDMIKVAHDGEEAIEHMEEYSFDLVLCDYNLGKSKDGQQVLEEAKHRSLLTYSSIYMMVTAENTSSMVMGAIDYMPDDYISKPFNSAIIHSRLKKLLDKKENLKDISRSISEKNYKKAIAYCENLLKTKPANRFDILKIEGEVLVKLGEYDKAADLYEDIIEQRDIPWAYMALGRIRYYQDNFDEALEIFEGMIKENSLNVSAYDWLAKTYEALDDLHSAQEALSTGVAKSPKSLVRQRRLAQVAYKNGDLETASTAYENAINEGRHSCLKQADDYNALAKALISSNKSDDAMKIAKKITKDFKNDSNAEMVAAMTEGMVHTSNGDTEEAVKHLDTALKLFNQNSQAPSTDIALELTTMCLSAGKDDAANEITKNLIRNNHENEALIKRTQKVYAEVNKSNIGDELINNTKTEIVEVNNKGARLLKEGKLEESIELFVKAARGMPDNIVVNLNTAYSLIMQMQKTGKIKKYTSRVESYLERVHKINPTNKKYHEMVELLDKVTIEARSKAA